MGFGTRDPTSRPDEPGWIEALSDGLVLMRTDEEGSDVHFSFRERPGLVGANHGGGAQRLDGREFSDQRASANHSLEPQCEADRHDRGEALGNRRDGLPDGGQEEQLDMAWVPEDADHEDEAGRKQDRDADLPPEAIQLLLERRLFLRLLLYETGDLAKLSRHPGLDEDGLPSPAIDGGPHEHHVLAVAQEGLEGMRLDGLAHRERLGG